MHSKVTSAVLAAVAGAACVAGHGHVSNINIDGTDYEGFDPTSAPYTTPADSIAWSNGATDNGFVLSDALQDPDIICHLDASNAALTATGTAGSNVTITWNTWPDSHKGPVIDYLADCGGDCTTVDKTSLEFFKIAQSGQLTLGTSGTPGEFATDVLIDDSFTWTVTIPESLKPGSYVWRHEIIALHEASTEGKAQMYPQCFNIKVTGSGSQAPSGVVGTSLYSSTDAGIEHNIYNDDSTMSSPSDYVVPGPDLVAFDGSSSGDDSSAATTASASQTSEATATATGTGSGVETTAAAAAAATTTSAAAAAATTLETTAAATTSSPAATATVHKCSSRRKRRSHARQL
ncbi:lytic polysaccharide monooxygenase [Xylariaceae sp. FL0804]|nr:lytic polysaccharide monooxygenase [Xylariaceae sp. FL0804]